jgi:hypothetical protein
MIDDPVSRSGEKKRSCRAAGDIKRTFSFVQIGEKVLANFLRSVPVPQSGADISGKGERVLFKTFAEPEIIVGLFLFHDDTSYSCSIFREIGEEEAVS